ncbi:hypothetical protein O3P69_017223 [Scylla paramamosain]|uniref:Carboxylesterase type B domain-containing protein n=1 Tax=Scylla paramamosain TaxID=85552 RepID=A0AAW0TY17_SCYPA
MILLVTLVVAATVAVAGAEQSTVEATLKQGSILGSREETTNGRVYYTFKSIPYAKPPVGSLRFKDPEPAPAWSGVRNGSLPIQKCSQPDFLAHNKPVGQEDCLYLNVYTPRPYSSNLPVMVYIHGGGFIIGSAEDQGSSPKPLMEKDVVVVALNYRLGILGFLSTGDNVLPGNLGLKDQILALQWVQDNIMELGGDPNQVTIFGISAGGMSVHFHILSPLATGLFRRAIMQSGTALVPSLNTSPMKGAIKIGKALNCTGEKSNELLACFNEATVEDLLKAVGPISNFTESPYPLGPCVDGAYLPDHPEVLLKNGLYNRADIMSGCTKDDGNVVTISLLPKIEAFRENFTKTGPIALLTREEENPVYLARRIMLYYMHNRTDFNLTSEDEYIITKAAGDRYFLAPNMMTVEFHAKDPSTKTFMYQFDHPPEKSLMFLYANITQERKMVGHGDDMIYLFDFPAMGSLKRLQDLQVQEILVDLFTNFAFTGNPTANGTLGFRWTPIEPEGPLRYLSITTIPTMQTVDRQHREFWTSMPTKINKVLYPERFLEDF